MKQNRNDIHLPYFGVTRMLPFLRPYRKPLLIMAAGSFAGTLIDIVSPLLQRYALNHFIAEKTLDTLPLFLAAYLAVILFSGVMNYIACTLATDVEVWLDRDLRNRAFEHLQTLSFSYFNINSVGYIHARLMSDTSRLGTLFSWTMLDATWHITYLAGAAVVMLVINTRLAVLVLAILPVLFMLFTVFQKRMVLVNREVREINSRISGDFNEGITGAKTIKSLVIEDTIAADFTRDTDQFQKKAVESARLRGMFAATMSFASSAALAIVLWHGGLIAKEEIGTFSLLVSFAQGMMEPVRWLVDAISDLINGQVNIERLTRLLSTEPDVKDTPTVIKKYGDCFTAKRENWEPIRGDIELDNVTFRYPDGDENVLVHFSLSIPFGTNLAICGNTGAGKSSLVNLICRFYEPSEGRILIDGKDVRERSQLWLHSAIGYVLQTPHLFSGTVRENLLYGNPEATEQQIMEALHLVSAEGIVNRLENGLDTNIGESGELLSTGEKQLISFARAILTNPRILILDEATASVDTITEQKIQAAIDTVIHDRTSIVIAHRLSTVRNADWILVVDDGKIVEQGKHKDLMAQHGTYYNLYTRQYEDEETGAILNR